MRKITAALLLGAVVLAVAGTGLFAFSRSFAEKDIVCFSIVADEGYTVPQTAQNTQALEGLQNLLRGAKTTASDTSRAQILAVLCAEASDGTQAEYEIALLDEQLYARRDGKARLLDANAFYALLFILDEPFYSYRELPILTIGGQQEGIAAQSGDYRYRRLDGIFYAGDDTALTVPPPILELTGGQPLPDLDFSREGAQLQLQVLQNGGRLDMDSWPSIATLPSGEYTVEILADWDTPYYSGSLVYPVEISVRNPVRMEVVGTQTYPGEAVVLRAYNLPAGESIRVTSDIAYTPTFFSEGDGTQVALFPISYVNAPGTYRIVMSCADESRTFSIIVQPKQFQIQNLVVSQETAEETVNSQKANLEYEQAIAPLRFVADNTAYWQEPGGGFVWPSTARRTTEFGMIRYVNGAPTSTRHGAIDFAIPLGTDVPATASGRVLYAGFLQLTGNTVLIEHGYGLKSWYYHMNSLSVTTGEMVKSGQIIGQVGSTGFSTGAHLHFGISVNNIFINPETIINTNLLDVSE